MSHLNSSNSLEEWLSWLETLHPKSIDLGITRIAKVAEKLGLYNAIKKTNTKIITIAGTNGKGTCVATLQALLLAANKTVGAYTSPHLIRYNERIGVNGQFATDVEIVEVFQEIDKARGEITLSYFEFGTLAACLLFLKAKAEFWLLEVGLGGRLDAVNMLDADVAIVTSIDLDHQNWLGDTREKIGFEKAGIFRQSKLAICVDPKPPKSLIDHASNIGANLLTTEQVCWQTENQHWRWFGLSKDNNKVSLESLRNNQLPLPSQAAAIQAVLSLEVEISNDSIRETISNLVLSGRSQQLEYRGRQIILDVAHNPAAAENLALNLAKKLSSGNQARDVYAVFSVMGDKDIPAIVKPLEKMITAWFVSKLNQIPRAASTEELVKILRVFDANATECGSVQVAIESALNQSKNDDILLIFGSFYTVGDALQWFQSQTDS